MANAYLLEIDVVRVDGSTRERRTLRFSSFRPNPLLFTEQYDARIAASGLPSISKSIQSIFYGSQNINYGSVTIGNADGEYNYLISDGWSLEGQPFRLMQGGNGDAQGDFVQFLTGKTGVVTFDSDYITFELSDASADLTTITHADMSAVSSTVQDVIDGIIETAGLTASSDATSWLTTYGSYPVYLNFSSVTLSSVLNNILTPLLSFYEVLQDGTFSIKRFEIPSTSDTPDASLTERDVTSAFSRTSLRRQYWRVSLSWLNSGTQETLTAHDGEDVNGAAVSLSGGTQTGIPVASHSFEAGDPVRIYGDVDYQGTYTVQSGTTATRIAIDRAYTAKTFSDTIVRSELVNGLSLDGYSITSILSNEAQAQTAADDYLSLLKEPIYKFSAVTKPQIIGVDSINLGDHVRIALDQPYGTIDGIVTRLVKNISANTITIEAVTR